MGVHLPESGRGGLCRGGRSVDLLCRRVSVSSRFLLGGRQRRGDQKVARGGGLPCARRRRRRRFVSVSVSDSVFVSASVSVLVSSRVVDQSDAPDPCQDEVLGDLGGKAAGAQDDDLGGREAVK